MGQKKLEDRIAKLVRENEIIRNINRTLIKRTEKLEKVLEEAKRDINEARDILRR